MFVVFSVAFISLPENSNAETLMSSKKKVERINDMAEKMQKDFDEMKSNFHKLEISNLMLKLQIHEIKDNFQGEKSVCTVSSCITNKTKFSCFYILKYLLYSKYII